MGFKLVRIDADKPVKISLNAGEYLIGRGSFLDCDDKRVSREHGMIVVTQNTVQLKSLHHNPCFYNKLNLNRTDVLPKGKTIDLKNTDHFGLLPNSYWYELIHCADETGDDRELDDFDIINRKRQLDQLTADAKEAVVNWIDSETQQYSFRMGDIENTEILSTSPNKRPHSPGLTYTKRIKTEPDISIEEDLCIPMPQSRVDTPSPYSQTFTQDSSIDITLKSRIPDTNLSENSEANKPTENVVNITEGKSDTNNSRTNLLEENNTSLNDPEISLNMEPESPDENNESQGIIPIADIENLIQEQQIPGNNMTEKTNGSKKEQLSPINPQNTNENVDQTNSDTEYLDPALFDEDMDSKSDNENHEQAKINTVKTEPKSPAKVNVKKEPESPENVKKDSESKAGPSNQPGSSSNGGAGAPPNRQTGRERCMYGANCYRKNPQHKAQFSHPGDSDYGDGSQGVCPYGAACRRRDPRHWTGHQHPPGTAPPPPDHRQGRPAKKRPCNAPAPAIYQSESEDSDDSPSPSPGLIVHGKRKRKQVKRESWSDSEEEIPDPYGTDESDEWAPPSDVNMRQSKGQDF